MYQSTYVRYERRGDRVVPVRVTKQWIHTEKKALDQRKEPTIVRAFRTTRVTELRRMPVNEVDPAEPQAPKGWQSSDRVESRERMMGLFDKDGEPVLQEAGYDQRWLPPGEPSPSSWRWTLDNGNGWCP